MRAVRFLFVVFISASVWASTQPADDVLFKPSLDQRLRSNLATKFLANWHYKDTRLDDELSVKIFDRYLDLLDPNFSFFLAKDIETFSPYRLHMDDALQHSDPAPAYEMFNPAFDLSGASVDIGTIVGGFAFQSYQVCSAFRAFLNKCECLAIFISL